MPSAATSYVQNSSNNKVTADAANKRRVAQTKTEVRNLASQPVALVAAGGFAAFVCWKIWKKCQGAPDSGRRAAGRGVGKQAKDRSSSTKKSSHREEMQRRKEKRDRHLDQGSKESSSKDHKDDDQKLILNFSYYDNKP